VEKRIGWTFKKEKKQKATPSGIATKGGGGGIRRGGEGGSEGQKRIVGAQQNAERTKWRRGDGEG